MENGEKGSKPRQDGARMGRVKFTKKHYRLPRRHKGIKVQINHREHGGKKSVTAPPNPPEAERTRDKHR